MRILGFLILMMALPSWANPPHYIGDLSDKAAPRRVNDNDRYLYDRIENKGIPTGAVMYFNLSACPNGWNEVTAARGRYMVGLSTSATLAATVGTELSAQENRAVGKHAHNATQDAHSHTYDKGNRTGTASGATGGNVFQTDWTSTASGSATPAVTVADSTGTFGTVGTNAPYIQFMVCEKL
jgi:hypothetical protein